MRENGKTKRMTLRARNGSRTSQRRSTKQDDLLISSPADVALSNRGKAGSTLVIAIGNTSLFCGVFDPTGQLASFRLPTSDLPRVARRVIGSIERAAVCSVVPAMTPDVLRYVKRNWNVDADVLSWNAPHGLTIGYQQPGELGADRIAAAIGARKFYPGKNIIVVDCGTATTVTATRHDGRVMGGSIIPGLSMWPDMLASRTALLPRVEVRRPKAALGRTTESGIAAGVFFGHVGAIRECVSRVRAEAFRGGRCVVIATGGEAEHFAGEKLFTTIAPDLILHGLRAFAARQIDS
jgi:type III pantothenate kinase